MKKILVSSSILAVCAFITTQTVTASISFTEKDMLFAFGSTNGFDTIILSEKEMIETEGDLIWFKAIFSWGRLLNTSRTSAVGATTGAVNYTASWGASQFSDNPQNFSQPLFWSSTAGGAIGGPIGSRWGTGGSIGGGAIGSSISGYYGNNNYGNNRRNSGMNVNSYCGSCYIGRGNYGWRR